MEEATSLPLLSLRDKNYMSKYSVLVREVWIQVYHVETDSPEEAMKKVIAGDADPEEGCIEYSHQLPSGTWTVEEDRRAAKN